MHILVVKTSSLGDIIQSFSAIGYLKKHFVDAKIDWIAEEPFCELLEAHPDVHRVIPIQARKWKKSLLKSRNEIRTAMKGLRKQKYHLLFDLQGNIKSAIIARCAHAEKKVGYTFSSAPEWPGSLFLSDRYAVNSKEPISLQYLSLVQNHLGLPYAPFTAAIKLKISPDEERWIEAQIEGLSKPRIMVCPGSHWENKKLSLKTWERCLKTVEKKLSPFFFFVWGTEKEKGDAEALHAHFSSSSRVLPRMRLPVWQRFMDQVDLILSVDSAALHLAATTSTSTFSIFGPSKGKVFKPIGETHHAFQGSCPYNTLFDKRCPILRTCKTGGCLKELSPDSLAQEVLKISGRSSKQGNIFK